MTTERRKAIQFVFNGGTMEEINAGVERFINACNELINGKFILADSKISDLLKGIAASEELTGLFNAVMDGFDYEAAKKAYLKSSAPHSTRGTIYLPADRKDLLAFVFCLLAEFDCGSMKFNDFLLRYFYEDGSYTASYTLFVSRLIRPFRDIVRDCYPDTGRAGDVRFMRKREDDVMGVLSEKVSVERARLKSIPLSREDSVAGEMILAELYAAAGRKDTTEIKALLCGYLYFLGAIGGADENSNEIFNLAAEL